MKKPFVGVVADLRSEQPGVFVPQNYLKAIEDAGALPVVLPFADKAEDVAWLAERFDGYLLTGGADVNPRAYGAPVLTHCGELQCIRDAFELALLSFVLAAGKPVLAICRGIQALNVAMGGTLYQDIDALHPRSLPLQHRQKEATRQATHALTVAPDSMLASIWGAEEVWVNSFHHQAVERVAPGLTATAWAADGVVEAVEMPGARFVIGVQWHPECMAATDEKSAALFRAFAGACQES